MFLNERHESGGVTGWYRRVPLLTAKLEWVAPKKRILNAYLNEVYVGKGHYGIRAAAQLYFGKAPAELDIPQAAFIAAVTRAPGRICRSTGREWALSQRNQIIDRLIVDGILTASSGEPARAAPLVVKGCFGNDAAALGRFVRPAKSDQIRGNRTIPPGHKPCDHMTIEVRPTGFAMHHQNRISVAGTLIHIVNAQNTAFGIFDL